MSRNKIDIGHNYPELLKAFSEHPMPNFIVDGEIIALEKGISSFKSLQQRMHIRTAKQNIPVYFCAFDITYYSQFLLKNLPLIKRKHILEALEFQEPIRYTTHILEQGEKFFIEACRLQWEGVIAKQADSPYVEGRSEFWLKFKCIQSQEFVIGGYTAPKGSRQGFGALLIGYYQEDALKYAGKVGTGFTDALLGEIYAQLRLLEIKQSPFSERIQEPYATWVKPQLIGEFNFTEWTREGKLRHPSFKGLRRDKSPLEVIREDKRF